MKKLFKRIGGWIFPAAIPETSDVVSVEIVRRAEDGRLIRFSLANNDASRWGFMITYRYPNSRFKELKWNREEIS